jgi:hypothetical protein
MKKVYFRIGFVFLILVLIYLGYLFYYNIILNNILNDKDVASINVSDNDDITINIKKGSEYASIQGTIIKYIVVPQLAIWIEDMNGNFIKTVYSTPKIKTINRESALPVWQNKVGEVVDTISSATPQKDTNIGVKKPENLDKYNIFLEVNRSYDTNNYYKMGDDYSGQPSLIYKSTISNENKAFVMELIGHGSPTGKDGVIYKDLTKITTASNILKEIQVVIR